MGSSYGYVDFLSSYLSCRQLDMRATKSLEIAVKTRTENTLFSTRKQNLLPSLAQPAHSVLDLDYFESSIHNTKHPNQLSAQ